MRPCSQYTAALLLGLGLLGWESRSGAQQALLPEPGLLPAPLRPGDGTTLAPGRPGAAHVIASTEPGVAPALPSLQPNISPVGFQWGPEALSRPGPDTAPARAAATPAATTAAPTAAPSGTQPDGQGQPFLLAKIGPKAINVGKPFTYELVVRNPGSAALYQVRVEDELPPGGRFLAAEPRPETSGNHLVWNLGTVDPDTVRHIKVNLVPASDGEFQSQATATFSTTSDMRTRVTRPLLSLVMARVGTEPIQVGDKVRFQLEAQNPGTGPATNVVIRDTLPAGLQHPQGKVIDADVGTLAAGEARTITLETTAVKAGRFANPAVAEADDDLKANAEVPFTVTEPALALRKIGPQESMINRPLQYRLEVANPGTAPAEKVQLSDLLPEGLDFMAASDGGAYDPSTRSITWLLGTLPPGQTRVMLANVLAKGTGDWINRAVARADHSLEAKSELTVHVEGVPALTFEVVDLDDPLEVGAETTYEIHVINQGSCPCVNLRINATVPDGMAALGADGPTANQINGNQVSFAPLPKLGARADTVYRVHVRGLKPGDWRFRAEMRCDQQTLPTIEEESTQVYGD